MKIAVVGNYLPRQCGIATFTQNFVNSLFTGFEHCNTPAEIFVIAMNGKNQHFDYPEIVECTIRQDYPQDYLKAARYINSSSADICILQHEFGIYGGESGVFVLSLLECLKIPVVIICHTVLKTPSFHEKAIMKKMGERADKVVVMSRLAIQFLTSIYHIPEGKISMIHHGVPDFGSVDTKKERKLTFPGKTVMCTFGLLGRNKGIETVIKALPMVVKTHPDIVYVVLGKTHPMVKLDSGEEYREYLKCLAGANGITGHVVFLDEFLDEDELKENLLGVDIYITPYLNEAQITSGTLAYAVGSGTCIVSTPYWHARELLAENRGLLFEFGDSCSLANVLNELLDHPEQIKTIRNLAFSYGKKMYWGEIGKEYARLFNEVISAPGLSKPEIDEIVLAEPEFSLDHIRRMTDNTGILEHSNFSIANFSEGYSLDDNARALLLVLMAHEQGKEKDALHLADIYMRYIHLMQKPDGSFHNELTYDRKFSDKNESEDALGRTIWALGYLIRLAPADGYFQFAKDKFFRFFPHFRNLQSNRGLANAIIGLCHFLKRYPDNEKVMKTLHDFTQKIREHFYDESDGDWRWFEPILCYDNAIVPLALWHSYQVTRDTDTLKVATESTMFLDREAIVDGRISLIGNEQWYRKGQKRPRFGQQPINAMALVMMHRQAFLVTGNDYHRRKMLLAFSWFTGNNDLHIPLYDEESKGCCDGIEKFGLNRNQGAESCISYQLASLTVSDCMNRKSLH
jgi:glycosyltransferase involved in cell wall biosynthesis